MNDAIVLLFLVGIPTTLSALGLYVRDRIKRRRRIARLTKMFGSENAQRVLLGEPWPGASGEMVIETLGHPHAIDDGASRDGVSHVFKYHPMPGFDRYRIRVWLHNGAVTSWRRTSNQ